MMYARTLLLITIVVIFLFLTGCSGSGVTPLIPDPPAQPEIITADKETESQHNLWGFWTIRFDPTSLKLEVEPLRNPEFHIDITDMILPPACDNCLEVTLNSFDPDTGMLIFFITLRNPFPITGHDVRGIIFTDDVGHLLTNGDDWTGLHDIPGGHGINPFKGFYGLYGESEFGPGDARIEQFQIYIPDPPHFTEFKFAVDASYPGQCKEPYAITDFTHGPFYDVTGHTAVVEVKVSDWQDDVCKVSLVAPEITGQPFTQFYPHEDVWRIDLTNNTGASAGEYEARIIANSTNSGNLVLHDYVTIEITEAVSPIPLYIHPSSGIGGTSLVDVDIKGTNFSGPELDVALTCESGPDIVATDVELIDAITIRCDIDIPYDAWLGLYDVEITNSLEITGVTDDMFLVYCPDPLITSINPNIHRADDEQFVLTVYGNEFIDSPDLAVKLSEGGQPDIVASNITLIDASTITCDITIPAGTPTAYWDVEVTNGCGTTSKKIDTFRIYTFAWNEPVISLDSGFNTKVRDASNPTVSSYQSNTDFVIQGDLCIGEQGTPVYQYYISTSDAEQVGDIWHEFSFTGDDTINVDWTNYASLAPDELWLWVRCVDGDDSGGPYLFSTAMLLSQQIWGDENNFYLGWTDWKTGNGAWWAADALTICFHSPPIPGTGDGGIRRNGTTFLDQSQIYTLESCFEYAWYPCPDCYIEPQIGLVETLGTVVGPQFTDRAAWEYLSVSFTVPVSYDWYIGFYGCDANDAPGPLSLYLDNICLFHDP